MRRFGTTLAVMLSLAVFGSVVSLVPQRPATGAGGAPVNIMSPLPLPVTGNVNATVTGPVAAQQSGAWNVGISGAPSVHVSNAALPTQDIGGGAATQVGQVASQVVNLNCSSSICLQQFPDGTLAGTAYSIPSGKALVITDVQWFLSGAGAAGDYASVALLVNGFQVAGFWSQQNAGGFAAGQARLTTGIVVASGNVITASVGSFGSANFQGYLVPNQ